MRVLVMGGTQFNGLALVRELAKHGHDVSVLNRGKTDARLPRGVTRLVADRTDPESVERALAGLEFDCVQDMTAYHPADVEQMVELFRGRIGHYIFASSTVIYSPSNLLPIREDFPTDRGPEQNEYGLHKLLCEDILIREHREHGFPASIAAFSMVFGPNNILPDREQRMFMRILSGRQVLIPGDGTTVGQVGHVEDEARALRMMMLEPVTFGKRYNLTGADYYTDEGYVDTFGEVMGMEPRKVFVPAELMDRIWDGSIDLRSSPMQADIDIRSSLPADQRAMQLFQVTRILQRLAPNLHRWNRSVFFSIERLKQDIGWTPEYTFRSAVEQTWDWFRAEGLDKTREFDFGFEDDLLARLGA